MAINESEWLKLGSNQTTSTAELDWNQQLTQLDALLVISISFIWILVVILIIFEKKFLNKVPK